MLTHPGIPPRPRDPSHPLRTLEADPSRTKLFADAMSFWSTAPASSPTASSTTTTLAPWPTLSRTTALISPPSSTLAAPMDAPASPSRLTSPASVASCKTYPQRPRMRRLKRLRPSSPLAASSSGRATSGPHRSRCAAPQRISSGWSSMTGPTRAVCGCCAT
jgi:hypothetical protein